MSEYIVHMPSDMPYEIKAELNAWYINSEPIVRCRDCRRFHANTNGIDCPKLDPDGFCAWGERNE